MDKYADKTREISLSDIVAESPNSLEISTLVRGLDGTGCFITSPRIQKLGLALTGFSQNIQSGRIQILGQSEVGYLDQLSDQERRTAIASLNFSKIACILVTKGLEPPNEMLVRAQETATPVIGTPLTTLAAISTISNFLERKLARRITIHGEMMGIFDLGVLIIGESGIGKSECALDLISQGHRLISDDAVFIRQIGGNLEAGSPELTQDHLEVRGLGIVDVRDVYGISAVGKPRNIDLCLEFRKLKDAEYVDRLGLELRFEEILDVRIPKFVLPVGSGRNLASLAETAVGVYLLKMDGRDASRELLRKHNTAVSGNN